MNQFHLTGKVIHIGKYTGPDSRGLTIAHYPDNINDSYFDMGLVFPTDLWLKYDIQTYDFIEVKGHYLTINKTIDPKKAKLIHVVDEIIKLEHEND